MSHYDTLQVAPWAEDAVIQAAYRALMRLYHPDTNHDPDAELRVRDITRAFAVLRDPEKRAAYDALPRLDQQAQSEKAWFGAGQFSRASMRNLGIGSLALALILGLAVAAWSPPHWRGSPQELRTRPANSATSNAGAAVNVHRTQERVVAHANGAPRVTGQSHSQPVLPSADTQGNGGARPTPRREIAQSVLPTAAPSTSLPKRQIAQVVVPKPPPSTPVAGDRMLGNASRSSSAGGCRGDTSKVGNGECRDDRQVQIEEMATGFLKQSMEHADWHKQQLLLSAQNRSAFSRTLCHSNDCITEAYLRQIRETTEIMEGRIPNP